MNLFGLFNRNKRSVDKNYASHSNTDLPVEDFTVDRDFFVDELPPKKKPVPKQNPLEEFLNHNYEVVGFNDGYVQHTGDGLDSKVRSLEARFRLLIDRLMENKRSSLYELRQDLCRVEGVSSRLEKELREKACALEEVIERLEEQKRLSVEHEGYFASVANAYRLGYKRGVEQYYHEKELGINTGLF